MYLYEFQLARRLLQRTVSDNVFCKDREYGWVMESSMRPFKYHTVVGGDLGTVKVYDNNKSRGEIEGDRRKINIKS